MATGKKQNGRCPFPKKAKFRAIQHWLQTVITIIETLSLLAFSFVLQIHQGWGEKGLGALATDIRSWHWWHRQSGGFAATLYWRKLSLALVLVNFGNGSWVSVYYG